MKIESWERYSGRFKPHTNSIAGIDSLKAGIDFSRVNSIRRRTRAICLEPDARNSLKRFESFAPLLPVFCSPRFLPSAISRRELSIAVRASVRADVCTDFLRAVKNVSRNVHFICTSRKRIPKKISLVILSNKFLGENLVYRVTEIFLASRVNKEFAR